MLYFAANSVDRDIDRGVTDGGFEKHMSAPLTTTLRDLRERVDRIGVRL
jgi:hypothetical protein